MCTQWVAKNPNFLHADSEDSDQPGQSDLSLCWVHTHFVGFDMSRLILTFFENEQTLQTNKKIQIDNVVSQFK